MNAPERFLVPDVQASADVRDLAIQRVGVKAVRYPLRLRTRTVRSRTTSARTFHNQSAYVLIEGENP